jgi:hypothetical protein
LKSVLFIEVRETSATYGFFLGRLLAFSLSFSAPEHETSNVSSFGQLGRPYEKKKKNTDGQISYSNTANIANFIV